MDISTRILAGVSDGNTPSDRLTSTLAGDERTGRPPLSSRLVDPTPAPSTAPEPDRLEVLAGLRADPPTLSPRWFYDALGSALFEAITRVPEYYPTRCELAILERHGSAIGQALGTGAALIELGCGSAQKVARLLPHMHQPRAYHPIDVSRAALAATKKEVEWFFPRLPVEALHGDFTRPPTHRGALASIARRGPVVLFFPGSTIGNFTPAQAEALLADYAAFVPPQTPFVLGVDLLKDVAILEAAYDDAAGVTAAFNRNALAHLNARFGADFDPARWSHEARWVPEHRRVEMWLRCDQEQHVRFGDDEVLRFPSGSGIHTESSHKWTIAQIEALACASGWRMTTVWTDERQWFAEALLIRAP